MYQFYFTIMSDFIFESEEKMIRSSTVKEVYGSELNNFIYICLEILGIKNWKISIFIGGSR